jgi:thymidylate kinase
VLVLKTPSSGLLLSLNVINGSDALAAAKRLLKNQSEGGPVSAWDASSMFFEMHGLEVSDRPSPRTLLLLYAADLCFRLRWEILPAMQEGRSVVAVPYLATGFAFGSIVGLPEKWLTEVFRFAPKPGVTYRLNRGLSTELGPATAGFIEYCSATLNQDLRPKFAQYFDELERRGRCVAI